MSNAEVQIIETEVMTHNLLGDVRFFEDEEEIIWFVAADVAKILGLKNIRQNFVELDDNEKGVCIVYTLGGPQEMLIVNEPGLYRLIFMSRKPEAKEFKRWFFHEVLPQIRKYGYYSALKDMDREELRKMLPYMTEEEKISLAEEPDITVWRVPGEKTWRVKID